MTLGLSVAAITLIHVVISIIGIVTGLMAMIGLLTSKPMPRWTTVFLLTTILTSVTGFMFPFDKLLPSHVIGIISL
ncbi:MAG: hypothetical protein EON84_17590, partial [Bradyrhizobiaceae bacterium]